MKRILAAALLLGGAALPSGPTGAEASACPRSEEAKYLGSKACLKCHFKQHLSWQKTKMAKAFETLKPGQALEAKQKAKLDPAKDYTQEAKCVACHVTGYGKPGGYPALVDGKEWTAEEKARATLLQGVGCESCHGPGEKTSPYKQDHKEYAWKDLLPLGALHPVEATCRTCHNEQSPSYVEFKFAEKVVKDLHEVVKMKADHGCDHVHAGGK